jgi:hypothetical protein
VKPRELRGRERDDLWNRIGSAWGVTGECWYPLTDIAKRDVLALQAPHFQRELVDSGKLRNLLAAHAVQRVFELREGGSAYELELADLEPRYTGDEGYWCSEAMDWIMYASHESSITVGGRWLIKAVEGAWPEWERHVWTSPFFD